MIEKDVLLNNLSKIEHLAFGCECCKKGVKVYDKSKYFESESEFSRREFTEDVNGFKTKINRRFSAGFVCSNPECSDISIFVGDKNSVLQLKEDIYQGQVTQIPVYHDKLFIHNVTPTLNLFDIGSYSFKSEGSALEKELRNVFDVFWVNADCSGMKIRAVLEVLMDDNYIDKTFIDRKGKVTKCNLFKRIELFHNKYLNEDLKAVLINLREFGNIGSHPGEKLTREIVVLMVEILECILNQLYTNNRNKLIELDKQLIESVANTRFN